MYTLSDGRVAFFKPEVAREIDALHLAPGQPFLICERGKQGWQIEYAHKPENPVNGSGEDLPRIMTRCYSCAIEIAVKAVDVAKAKGLMICPTFEDIRALAATLVITETGRR